LASLCAILTIRFISFRFTRAPRLSRCDGFRLDRVAF